jgi:ComF family protein
MSFYFLDFLFPPRSLNNSGCEWVSADERAVLKRCRPVLLQSWKLWTMGAANIDRLAAGVQYDDVAMVQTAIRRFKYGRIRGMGPELAPLLFSAYSLLGAPDHDTVITWVPLHWTRRFWRGFDQAEDLAMHLSRSCGLPVIPLLQRVRPTGHQARRTGHERRTAMHDAFRTTKNRMPRRVILIDDVATTGSTIDACAAALKSAGVSQVDAVVLALA